MSEQRGGGQLRLLKAPRAGPGGDPAPQRSALDLARWPRGACPRAGGDRRSSSDLPEPWVYCPGSASLPGRARAQKIGTG